MPVSLGDDLGAVDRGHLRPRLQLGQAGPEPHRGPLLLDADLIVHQVDDRVRRRGGELAAVGAFETDHVAGELDDHHVQAEAQAEARYGVLAGVAGCCDLAFQAALTETAGDHDPVEAVEAGRGEHAGDLLGLDPVDLDLGPVVEAGVLERLHDRHVGVGKVHVLADDPDADDLRRGAHPFDKCLPAGEVDLAIRLVEAQDPADDVVEAFLVQVERYLVDVLGIDLRDDRIGRHVTEQGDLALQVLRDRLVAAAHDHVGLDARARAAP